MPIEASEPTVISATYDKWAFTIATSGLGLARPGEAEPDKIQVCATLVKYRVRDEDGVGEQSPLPTDTVTVRVHDLYALMEVDEDVATAFAAMVAAVEKIAHSQGAI